MLLVDTALLRVNSNKYGVVGEIQAKGSFVGEIETKQLFVGEFVKTELPPP